MGKNALIIDSNPKSIKSLTNMLTYFHYKVETINTLEEADKLLSQVAFDMLIIDEQKLSKYSSDMIQLIKAKYDIKIILIESMYYQNTNNIRHLEEIDSYLMKPFSQNSIFNVILEVYGEKQTNIEPKPKVKKEDLSLFKNIEILIAEDNIINQRVIAGLLDGSGFKLIMANNGQEAIEKLSKHPNVDLILMDINMNIMDGYTATKTIREYSEYDDIPIFALTANSLQKDIDIAMKCGMQGYLTKPLNIDSLYEKLFTLFSESDKEKKEKRYYDETLNYEEAVESQVSQPTLTTKKYHFTDLDADLGLENSNNSKELYATLLKNFLEMYSDATPVLTSIIKERRYTEGVHFVHDIKGLAAYLGGEKVVAITERLEKEFKSEKLNEHSILINKFARELEKLLADINSYLKK
jgi:CheY-like chemotaxis protein